MLYSACFVRKLSRVLTTSRVKKYDKIFCVVKSVCKIRFLHGVIPTLVGKYENDKVYSVTSSMV